MAKREHEVYDPVALAQYMKYEYHRLSPGLITFVKKFYEIHKKA